MIDALAGAAQPTQGGSVGSRSIVMVRVRVSSAPSAPGTSTPTSKLPAVVAFDVPRPHPEDVRGFTAGVGGHQAAGGVQRAELP